MKKDLPLIAFVLLAIGTFFKIEHWPGANVMLLISALSIIISTVFEFTELEHETRTRGMQIVIAVMIITCTASAIFKIFHWPGASFMVSLAFNITIPASIVFFTFNFNKTDYRLSRNLTSGIFYLMLLLMAFFPGNPIGEANQKNMPQQQNMLNEASE